MTLPRRPLSGHARPQQRQGQALAEFLVMSVAMVPLFLLLPMIGKYQDINHAAQAASRYVAFDATTRNPSQSSDGFKPPAQLADEVRRRFFSNSDAPIKTGDTAGDFNANRNLFWRDPFGNPLIAQFNDVGISFGQSAPNQVGGFNTASDGQVFNLIPLTNAPTLGLQSPGVLTGNVSVNLANLPSEIKSIAPFDAINLSLERHTSLIVDGWSARSPQQAEDRFGNLVASTRPLQTVQPVLNVAIPLLEFFKVSAPQFGNLQAWRDVVPADRLVAP